MSGFTTVPAREVELYESPERAQQIRENERQAALVVADTEESRKMSRYQGERTWESDNAESQTYGFFIEQDRYRKVAPPVMSTDEMSQGPNLPHRDDKANSLVIRLGNARLYWQDAIDAGLSDAHLPTREGGEGKRNPMDKSGIRSKSRAPLTRGVDYASIPERKSQWAPSNGKAGETYVKPHGTRNLGRPLNGPSDYLRYWKKPTETAALRNLSANTPARHGYATVTMSRGVLKMWVRLHDIMVDMGKFTDGGRSAALRQMIDAMPADADAVVELYRHDDYQWFLKRAPKRYREGEFGKLLHALAS